MGANISTSQSHRRSNRKRRSTRAIALHDSGDWKFHAEECRRTNKLMVIDFSASWCGPCQFMEPVIEDFSVKYTDVLFSKIDVDELPEVAHEFGVDGMPTFVLIKNKKELEKLIGAKPEELENLIQKHRF